MKPVSEFIFVLIALGTLVCATYAFPTSSEIRQESDDDHTALQEELLAIVANSQHGENTVHTAAQSLGSIMSEAFVDIQKGFGKKLGRGLRGAGSFIKRRGKGIAKGIGRFTGDVLEGLRDRNTGRYPPRYPDTAPRYPDTAPRYPDTAPRYPDTIPAEDAPGDSGGYETDLPSKEEEIFESGLLQTAEEQYSDNTMNAAAQSVGNIVSGAFVNIQKGFGKKFGRGLKRAGSFIKTHRRGITKGLGRFTGELLSTLGGRDTSTYYPGTYPGAAPRYRYPDVAPRYPDVAPRYPDMAPRYPDMAPDMAPRYPQDNPGYPGDSLDGDQSQPDGYGTNQPSEEEENIESELLQTAEEEVAAPFQHNSFIRKQNKYRQPRRGFTHKVKRFFKDLYQVASR